MAITNKSKKITKRSTTRALLVKELAKKFQVDRNHVYLCLRGDSQSETAEEIKREYNRLMKAIDNVLK
ncbi:MAG: hypothetical protein JST88_09170 [Bacteroidetes bacterium]|nr:hypothetical protein [Bacteroidota bacterium]